MNSFRKSGITLLAFTALLASGCAHTGNKSANKPPLFSCHDMREFPAHAAKANSLHDFNKDGSITREEYSCQIIHRFARHDKNRDHSIHTGKELSSKHTWHQGADRNKDGKMSIMEFMKATDRAFDLADTNHDGLLSKLEAKESKYHP